MVQENPEQTPACLPSFSSSSSSASSTNSLALISILDKCSLTIVTPSSIDCDYMQTEDSSLDRTGTTEIGDDGAPEERSNETSAGSDRYGYLMDDVHRLDEHVPLHKTVCCSLCRRKELRRKTMQDDSTVQLISPDLEGMDPLTNEFKQSSQPDQTQSPSSNADACNDSTAELKLIGGSDLTEIAEVGNHMRCFGGKTSSGEDIEINNNNNNNNNIKHPSNCSVPGCKEFQSHRRRHLPEGTKIHRNQLFKITNFDSKEEDDESEDVPRKDGKQFLVKRFNSLVEDPSWKKDSVVKTTPDAPNRPTRMWLQRRRTISGLETHPRGQGLTVGRVRCSCDEDQRRGVSDINYCCNHVHPSEEELMKLKRKKSKSQLQLAVDRKRLVEERLEAQRLKTTRYLDELKDKQEQELERANLAKLDRAQQLCQKVMLHNARARQMLEQSRELEEQRIQDMLNMHELIEHRTSLADTKARRRLQEESNRIKTELQRKIEKSQRKQHEMEEELKREQQQIVQLKSLQRRNAEEFAARKLTMKSENLSKERETKEKAHKENMMRMQAQEEEWRAGVEASIQSKDVRSRQLQQQREANSRKGKFPVHATPTSSTCSSTTTNNNR